MANYLLTPDGYVAIGSEPVLFVGGYVLATGATIASGAGSAAGSADVQGVGATEEASQLIYWGDRPRQNRQLAALQKDDKDMMLIIQMYMAMEETWQTLRTA